jgi:hypothetical protein
MRAYTLNTPADTPDFLPDVAAGTQEALAAAEAMGIDARAIEALRRINPSHVHFRCDTVLSVIERYDLNPQDVYDCLVVARAAGGNDRYPYPEQ